MTGPASPVQSESSHDLAGRAAIVSGALGVIAFGLLITFLVRRLSGGAEQATVPVMRAHDLVAILQFLLLLPLLVAIAAIVRPVTHPASRGPLLLGVVSVVLVIVCFALIFTKGVPDDLYMIPQGVFGLWLIGTNRRLASVLPRGLIRLGTVAGVGLVLIGSFPIAFALFVDHAHLLGWTPYDYQPPPGTDMANGISHLVLVLGTFTGLTTFPVWTVLVGHRMRRTRGSVIASPQPTMHGA